MISFSPTTLSLDFINNTATVLGEDYTLDKNLSPNSRNAFAQYGGPITFSRGSQGMITDFTGKITYGPNNILTYSQDLTNAAWNKSLAGTGVAPTVTGNAAVAPDGTTTASLVSFNRGTGNTLSDRSYVWQTISGLNTGSPYLFSFYIKAGSTGDVGKQLSFRGAAAAAYTVITLTNSWQRVYVVENAFSTSSTCEISDRGTITADNTVTAYIWGAQCEAVTYQTTPSQYIPTTAAAYYGPRFDYDPVTLANKGMLIEEQRTNLLTYSDQFDNAAWGKANVTVTPNTTVAPDGTTTADTITSSGIAGYAYPSNSGIFSSAGGATYTLSVYAKAGNVSSFQLLAAATATYTGNFDLAAGTASTSTANTTVSITSVGNGWYRCVLTCASVANTAYTELQFGRLASGNTIIFWGAQLEVGSFATSYIPTVASTVTRSADVCSMTGTNFNWFNAVQGTFAAQFDSSAASFGVIGDNSGGVAGIMYASVRDIKTYNGVTGFATANLLATGAIGKGIVSYDPSIRFGCLNGGSVVNSPGTIRPTTSLAIGNSFGNSYLNGHIRSVQYYPTRLQNAQLQSLTT